MNPNDQENQQANQNQYDTPAQDDNASYPPQHTASEPAPVVQPYPPVYNDQQAAQPPVPAEQPYGQPQPPVGQPVEDPGKVFSIIGLVLAFVPLMALFGLILSIIGTVKSGKAHFSKVLGIVGIVLNALALLVGILGFVFFVLIGGVAYNGIQERAESSADLAVASTAANAAEAQYALSGAYPVDAAAVSGLENFTDNSAVTLVDGKPLFSGEIGYKKCSETGAQVYYIGMNDRLMIKPLGDASAIESC